MKKLITILLIICFIFSNNIIDINAKEDCQPDTLTYDVVSPFYENADDFEESNVHNIDLYNERQLQVFNSKINAQTYVNDQMKMFSNQISFLFQINSNDILTTIWNDILEYSVNFKNPEQCLNDELRFSLVRVNGDVQYINDNVYQLTYFFTYNMTTAQSKLAFQKAKDILSSLNLEGIDDYLKVKAIYKYVTDNVVYDYSFKKYSLYNALIENNSVCQGYALAMYVLLRDAGIDNRIIRGLGNGGAHAWNIVKINQSYYNLDATWDSGNTNWLYFLKSEEDFIGHSRDDAYNTNIFRDKYPMANTNYEKNDTSFNIDPIQESYLGLDGVTYNTANMNDKIILRLYYSDQCINSQNVLKMLDNSDIAKNSQIVIFPISVYDVGKDKIQEMSDKLQLKNIVLAYGNGRQATNNAFKYIKESGVESASVILPIIVTSGLDGKIRYINYGPTSEYALQTQINTLLDKGSDKIPAPTNIKILKAKEGYNTLQWTSVAMDEFEIYRSTQKDFGYFKIGTSKTTSFNDKDLDAKAEYYYKIKAKKQFEYSGFSDSTYARGQILASTIELNMSSKTVNLGSSFVITAKIMPSETDNKDVKWTSGNNNVVTVDSYGNVKASGVGKTYVYASTSNGLIAKCLITVTGNDNVTDIRINPGKATISIGNNFVAKAIITPTTAIDKSVVWSSSSPSIASVDADGNVKAIAPGYTYIICKTKNGITAKSLIQVLGIKPAGITLNTNKATLSIGKEFQIKGTIQPSNATDKTITWSSSSPSIASVDADGNVKAKAPGYTYIIGKTSNGVTAKSLIQVITINPTNVSMNMSSTTLSIGKSFIARASVYPSNATNKDVTFSSSNPEVASVDALGNVKTIGAGTAYIKATTVNGKVGQITVNVLPNPESIIISPKSATVKEGATFKATSVVSPSNAVKNVTYSSSTPAVASVDTQGNVKALRKGATYITVTTHNGKIAKFLLRVV